MERRLGTLQFIEYLLIKFLTRTQPRELNIYIFRSRELDHSLGQISNLDRFTHVKHEYLTAISLGTGLQNQFTSLRNQHEETDNVWMSNSHRPTILNLLAEQGNHRTVASQHITKACSHKLRIRSHLLHLNGLIQTLNIDLADTFRASHYVSWIHRLVRRNHYKFLHPIFHGHVSNNLGTPDIVQHRLRGVVFHHGHVLVGSCMEYIIRTEVPEYLIHTVLSANARHDGLGINLREIFRHHESDVMLGRLCLVYQYHTRRIKACHLSNNLRTDRTGTPRNQHTATFQQLTNRFHIHTNLRSRQQLLYADLTHLHIVIVQIYLCFQIVRIHLYRTLHHKDFSTSTDNDILYLLIITKFPFSVGRNHHTFNIIFPDNLCQVIIYRINLLS